MVCRNICDRLYSEKVVFGISNYSLGRKYCRKCEVYLYYDDVFCPCCKAQLRTIPHNKKRQTGWYLVDQSSDKDILNEEIRSWEDFEYALREENRLLFNKMLSECKENEDYLHAANSKDEYFSAESLFMVLILQQQKTINELIAKISETKKW